MRTTVELPSDLMKRAKAKAAASGESLKTLFTRAIATEIGSHRHPATTGRVKVPLFGNPKGRRVRITNAHIEQALADEDAASARRFMKPRKR
jgi:sugar lactone lactonase YvrE